MRKPDDLEQLWKGQPLTTVLKGEEMRDVVLKKINAFDRTLRVRNTSEIVAALAVAGFFLYALWLQRNPIEKIGSAMLVGAALWIVVYLVRYGAEASEPRPDQTVTNYRRALDTKYEHQIRLLRNAKFWYLLPLYLGLLTLTGGMLVEQSSKRSLHWTDALAPLGYTLVFGAVWWLNEAYAVRRLEALQTALSLGANGEQ